MVVGRQQGWQVGREDRQVWRDECHATVGEGGEAECAELLIRSASKKEEDER